MSRLAFVALIVVMALGVATCGGGGGGGGGDGGGTSTGRTTFTGNLAATTVTQAGVGDVEVCVEGTGFCTLVGVDGVFTLAADVGGDVTLVFTGMDFVARVALTGIPLGATVRLSNIRCSTTTGLCEPEDFEIEGGDETRSAIRCQQGPIHVAHVGTLVIDGGGQDCVRTEGQCEVTIEADRIVMTGCETCIRTAGGSEVTLLAGAGGIECDAGADGIGAAGNSAVHLDAANGGDVDIDASDAGARSQGTAFIEIAGDRCRIAGAESALRLNGNAEIDTDGCAVLDLVGGVNDDPGEDDGDDQGDDDDQGEDD